MTGADELFPAVASDWLTCHAIWRPVGDNSVCSRLTTRRKTKRKRGAVNDASLSNNLGADQLQALNKLARSAHLYNAYSCAVCRRGWVFRGECGLAPVVSGIASNLNVHLKHRALNFSKTLRGELLIPSVFDTHTMWVGSRWNEGSKLEICRQ